MGPPRADSWAALSTLGREPGAQQRGPCGACQAAVRARPGQNSEYFDCESCLSIVPPCRPSIQPASHRLRAFYLYFHLSDDCKARARVCVCVGSGVIRRNPRRRNMFYEHQKPLANKISRRKPVDKSDQRRRLGLRPAGVWSPLLAASASGGPGDRGARCRPLREVGAATAWALGQNQTANTAARHTPAGAGAQRGRGCHRPRRGCRRAWRALHIVTAAQRHSHGSPVRY